MVGMNGINNTMNNNNTTSMLNGTNGNNNNNNNNNTIMNHNHRNNNNNKKKKNQSKKKKFYPKLIATQIIAIQCFHYFILTLLYEMNAILFNPSTFTSSNSNIQMNSGTGSSSTSNKNMPLSITTTYMSLDHIFTDQYIHLYQLSSYPDIITTFIAAICTAYIFVIIIEKSKQCLDFAITLFILHIIFVSMYNYHIPNHIEWYIVHVLATIIMILLAEHLCAKRELDDIPLLTL